MSSKRSVSLRMPLLLLLVIANIGIESSAGEGFLPSVLRRVSPDESPHTLLPVAAPPGSKQMSVTPGSAAEGLQSGFAKYQSGDYVTAVLLFRADLAKNPDSQQAKMNLAKSLYTLGLFQLQLHRPMEALALLQESAALGYDDAIALSARLSVKQGQDAEEILGELFSAAMGSSDPQVLKTFVELALRADDLQKAESLLVKYEKLQNASAAFADAKRRQIDAKLKFQSNSNIVATDNVEVTYPTDDLRPLAETIARQVESTLESLSVLLGDPILGVKVSLFPNPDFQANTAAPAWAGGLFDGIIRLPVSSQIEKSARHEATHAYLYQMCGDTVPSWLSEGLAVAQEGTALSQSLSWLQRSLGFYTWASAPAAQLNESFVSVETYRVPLLYAQARVLVASIQKSRGLGIETWKPMLQQLCLSRLPFTEALEIHFGASDGESLWAKNTEALNRLLK